MTEDAASGGRPTPAYTSFTTFKNFLGSLKGAVPPQIDKSVMTSLSGGTQNSLVPALRSLGLTDQADRTLPRMHALAEAHGTDEWSARVDEMIEHAYGHDILRDFDLSTATKKMLADRFEEYGGVTGSSRDKAVRFFLAAIEETKRDVSPHLQVNSRGGAPRRPRRRRASAPADPPTPSGPKVATATFVPEGMKLFDLPLRPNLDVTVTLPKDLNRRDVDRMHRLLLALAFDGDDEE